MAAEILDFPNEPVHEIAMDVQSLTGAVESLAGRWLRTGQIALLEAELPDLSRAHTCLGLLLSALSPGLQQAAE